MTLRSLTQPLPWIDSLSAAVDRRMAKARAVPLPMSHALSSNASFLLDLVRFSAALMVVAAHLTHVEFGTGFRERQWLGDGAVQVFFVLSGFVIRYVTVARPANIREFFLDRAARMYSVMLPAMALTIVLSFVCLAINPHYFHAHWGAFTDHPVARVLMNLTFLSQSWGRTTIPLINSPFWSVSYECLFYIGYGLWFYLRGRRRVVVLTVWALVAGPQVLFLLPVWVLGAAMYDAYRKLQGTRAATAMLGAALGYVVLSVVLLAVGRDSLFLSPIRFRSAAAALGAPFSWLRLAAGRASFSALATGLLAAVGLLLLVLLADLLPAAGVTQIAKRFRPVADGTFAIYLGHYPLFVLAGAVSLLRPHDAFLSITVATAIVALLVWAAKPCERLKRGIRAWLNMVVPQPRWFPMVALTGPAIPAGRPVLLIRKLPARVKAGNIRSANGTG